MLQMISNGENGFGIRVLNAHPAVSISHQTMDAAVITFSTALGAEVRCALTVHSDGAFSQNILLKNNMQKPVVVEYALDLRLSVHRASYGQLTEGGPVPPPDCENHLSISDNKTSFTVSNPLLDAKFVGRLYIDSQPATLDGLGEAVSEGVLADASTSQQSVTIQPGSTVSLVVWFKLSPGKNASYPPSQAPPSNDVREGFDSIWNAARTAKTYIIRRNVDYILGSCAIPVSDNVVGLITDHVALPLGWNRDN